MNADDGAEIKLKRRRSDVNQQLHDYQIMMTFYYVTVLIWCGIADKCNEFQKKQSLGEKQKKRKMKIWFTV